MTSRNLFLNMSARERNEIPNAPSQKGNPYTSNNVKQTHTRIKRKKEIVKHFLSLSLFFSLDARSIQRIYYIYSRSRNGQNVCDLVY